MSDSVMRHIPPVGQLLEHPQIAPLLTDAKRAWVTRVVQRLVDDERRRLRKVADDGSVTREGLVADLVAAVRARHDALLGPTLKTVVNATGVLVHTNLGRSLYPRQAVDWLAEAALHNVDLEMDLETNRRGHRGRKVEEKLALLTGAEDALIVNNNASAFWLAVRAVAGTGRVILSRGEVVAIGGSFRMNDILAETGCELVEVGTTNRTSVDDYRAALTPGAVVLKVHRSNFALKGFAEEASLGELAELCRETGHVLIYDAGSGQLADLAALGLDEHHTLAADIDAGADLVTCSGDKLFGGGQAGMALGRRELVDAMRAHPMRRVLRVDKTTLAAVDGVLTHYLAGDHLDAVPTLRLAARDEAALQTLAEDLRDRLAGDTPAGWTADILPGTAQVGGGCSAEAELPTRLLLWQGPHADLERCHLLLRRGDPAVLARIGQAGLALDLRSVPDESVEILAAAVRAAWRVLADGKGAGS